MGFRLATRLFLDSGQPRFLTTAEVHGHGQHAVDTPPVEAAERCDADSFFHESTFQKRYAFSCQRSPLPVLTLFARQDDGGQASRANERPLVATDCLFRHTAGAAAAGA